ncbi:MAG: DUF5827 family protein [Halobaculum sp.]
MPRPKSDFDALYPCDFYSPEELLDSGKMYTVYEIARLLQDLEPEEELDPGEEDVLLDWAIPWVIQHGEELVIAEPPTEADPGYYGLREDGDFQHVAEEATAEGDAEGSDDGGSTDDGD